MTFPRILALSEVMWSPTESKDYKNFSSRLPYQFSRLAMQRVTIEFLSRTV